MKKRQWENLRAQDMAMKRYRSVDDYLDNVEHFREELIKLRKILHSTRLEEAVKWGMPYYTFQGKNVVGMSGFKSYFGLWFTQGALLNDDKKVLINAQEDKTKALRQWRMKSAKEIKSTWIKAYIKEAIGNVEQGRELKPAIATKSVVVPEELEKALKKHKTARTRFKGFTPGKQKEFANYISEAKRVETKLKRIEKILPMILDGVGLHDKYR